jgi:hypothetical protein
VQREDGVQGVGIDWLQEGPIEAGDLGARRDRARVARERDQEGLRLEVGGERLAGVRVIFDDQNAQHP